MTSFRKTYDENTLPVLVKHPITRVQLAQYAGASGDFNPIHIDEEFAQISPLGGVIAHGMLSMGFLSQYAEQLAEEIGEVKTIKVQFRAMVRPGDVVTCEAEQKELVNNGILFALYAKNQHGDIVVKGETTIVTK